MATCPAGHPSAGDDFCDVCGVLIGAAPSLGPNGALADRAAGANRGGSGRGQGPAAGPAPGRAAVPAEPCPRCGVTRVGQFCEACGYDFTSAAALDLPREPATVPPMTLPPLPVPSRPAVLDRPPSGSAVPAVPAPPVAAPAAPAGAGWTAVVTADRAYYDSVRADGGRDAADIAFPVYYPQRRFRLSGTEVRIGRRSTRSGIDPEIDLTGPPADPGVSRLHAVLLRAEDGTWSVLDPGSANGTLVNGNEIPRDQMVPVKAGDRICLGAWTAISILHEDRDQ